MKHVLMMVIVSFSGAARANIQAVNCDLVRSQAQLQVLSEMAEKQLQACLNGQLARSSDQELSQNCNAEWIQHTELLREQMQALTCGK